MFNKSLIIILFVLIFALSVSSTPVGDILIKDISSTSFSGKIGDDFTLTFKIKNNNPTENLTVNIFPQNFPPSYFLTIIPTTIVIPAGAEFPVAVGIDTDQTDATGVSLGRISAVVNASHSDFFDVNLNLAPLNSKLFIEKVEFEDTAVDDGRRYESASPGQSIKLSVKVKNNFTDDIDIDRIKIELKIINFLNEGRDDLEMDLPDFLLGRGAIETKEFNFEVPKDIDSDDYDVVITVRGRDEGSVTHEASYRAKLVVDRENNDVRFTRLIVNPTSIKCNRDVTFDVQVTNFGSDPQRDAAFSIRSDELGVFVRKVFELDEDPSADDYDYNTLEHITINDTVAAGSYRLLAKTFYDSTRESQVESINFVVEKCDLVDDTNDDDVVIPVVDNNDVVNNGNVVMPVDNTNNNNANIVEGPKTSGTVESVDLPSNNKGLLIALIIIIAVVAILLVLGTYYFMFVRE